MQRISIKFVSEDIKSEFISLKSGKHHEKQLYSFIQRAFDDIQKDINCSVKIPKKTWPNNYLKYDITNLFKYDLPNGWRLIFTLKHDEILVVAVILEWFNHKNYERRFKY